LRGDRRLSPAARGGHAVALALVALVLLARGPLALSRFANPAAADEVGRRVVAIGDLHGDLEAARGALRLAGAIDRGDHWVGGRLVVVQLGDLIDRGDADREVLELFDRLGPEAERDGGALVVLNGNHELMNVAGDFRYVTRAGMAEFGGPAGRRRAFAPGGPLASRLAMRSIYAVVGDTLFVHGGVLPSHVERGLAALDADARAWLRGKTAALPAALTDSESPLWTRRYGDPAPGAEACAAAAEVLARLQLRRMVVAHTRQERINAACGGQVWRVDVGLARTYGGPLEVLFLDERGAQVRHGEPPR
jgi:calcineurin-like phosphoesterase family protein